MKLRLAGLGLPLVLLAAVTAWLAYVGGQRSAELREGLLIAEEVDDAVVELKGQLHSMDPSAGATAWRQFHEESQALERWIAAERSRLTTVREHELLDNVAQSYDRYLGRVAELLGNLERGEIQRIAPDEIAALNNQLTEVRRRGAGQFLADSHRYLASLQRITVILLAALLAAVLAFVVVMYRGLVSPMELKLSQASEALEKSRTLAALGTLAAGVAHEIRNPLTAIKARLYTHQKLFPPDSPARADTEFIGEEIKRLERIVNEFLLFARPAEPQPEPLSPESLLQEVRDLLAPELAKSAITVDIDVAAGAGAIRADRNQIKQVLINLVRNAGESIGANGRITLRVRHARGRRHDRSTDTVILEVEDNGRGFAPEDREMLLDPFFTTKPNGTGLGLSIAARIAEKHGGTLQFQSVPGAGATVGLVLPAGSPS